MVATIIEQQREQMMNQNENMLPFINPGTGEQFGQVAKSTQADVSEARQTLGHRFDAWHQTPISERVRIMRKFQAMLIDSLDEITAVITQDTGKSRQDSLIEVMLVVDRMNQYSRKATHWMGRRRIPPGLYFFKRYYTQPHPYGVVAIISPWNYPFELSVSVVCAALLAGNTVMLKPSEVTPAVGALVADLFSRIPELAPYVQVLHGDGAVGAMVVDSHPDLVFLTGSTATARKISTALAREMIPFVCELGGKDAMIVLEDADILAAAKWGVWGANYHGGQSCVSIERAYVVESAYNQFVAAVVAETEKLRLGYSAEIDNAYHFGPMTDHRQIDIVEEHLKEAVEQGARIVTGGERNGAYIQPTVVVDADHSMKLIRDETFGPVMPIMKVKDEAEAVQLANDSRYGLSASVWSGDLDRAERVAHQLEVGSVNINDTISHYAVTQLPFGGVKMSGNARTHGQQDILQFTQMRSYALGRPPMALDIATKMREPNHYWLGSAIMRLAFGVTLKQRVQPIAEAIESLNVGEMKPKAGKAAVLFGAVAALGAFLFGLLRSDK